MVKEFFEWAHAASAADPLGFATVVACIAFLAGAIVTRLMVCADKT